MYPERTGATFYTTIPAVEGSNSSARFNQLPPNYLCNSAPFTMDHSASDPDGDSIEYFLYQPNSRFNGLSTTWHSPFTPVDYAGKYSEANQMNGNPRLSIDKHSGQLTVTPDKEGQYVIGIRAVEIRNGKVINEIVRDYQFNVIICDFDLLANFTTSKEQFNSSPITFYCEDTVQFY